MFHPKKSNHPTIELQNMETASPIPLPSPHLRPNRPNLRHPPQVTAKTIQRHTSRSNSLRHATPQQSPEEPRHQQQIHKPRLSFSVTKNAKQRAKSHSTSCHPSPIPKHLISRMAGKRNTTTNQRATNRSNRRNGKYKSILRKSWYWSAPVFSTSCYESISHVFSLS